MSEIVSNTEETPQETTAPEKEEIVPKEQEDSTEAGTPSEVKDVEVIESEVIETEITKKTSTNPSEYDSADSFSDAEDAPGDESKSKRSNEAGQSDESENDSSVILEREEGDGQESVQSKKVDDDEDKKNPQYIPKRGTFYEHDDRTADDVEETKTEEVENDVEKEAKKKIWTNKKEKWSHDKFNDNDQAPKSKQELIAIYGYDIRNEDGPPRARRRRRYGRGPNKYTRNWEDEDAYNKAPLVTKKIVKKTIRNSKNKLENAQLDDEEVVDRGDSGSIHKDNYENTTNFESNSRERDRRQIDRPSAPPSIQQRPRDFFPRSNFANGDRVNSNKTGRVGTGRIVKPSREIKDTDYKGFTKTRNYSKNTGKVPSRSNPVKTGMEHLEREMDNFHLSEPPLIKGKQSGRPPRLQTEPKGSSKRYSSIRQRTLPDTVAPAPFNQQHPQQQQQQPPQQQPQQHSYYPNEFPPQQNPAAANQTAPAPPQPPMIQTMPTQMAAIPPPPIPAIPAQVPVTSTPLPPQYPFAQAPPAFLQPAPPPFLPQQTPPPLLNYVQGQPFASPQAPFQGYQQPFNPVSQSAEIFQPPGGITYYSTQDQRTAPRPTIPKRPKAAIPIVPPPVFEQRGRGRSLAAENSGSPMAPGEMKLSDDNNSTTHLSNQFDDAAAAAVQP